jgi:CRP-like cAMP-binding protein
VGWKFLDISLLREIDLFKNLSEQALVEIIPLTSVVEYTPGQVIFQEGEMGDALFLILEGEVRISKNIHGVGEEALAFLKKGSYFGEMALVGEEQPRSAAAIAADRCEMAKLERKDFLELINANHKVGVEILWSFVTTLSARLRESNEKIAFFAMSNMFE